MRRADEEIEQDFCLTSEEIAEQRERDERIQREFKPDRKWDSYEKRRAYREANKERIAEYQHAYYEANKERVLAYKHAYHQANRKRIAMQARATREKNRANTDGKQRWIKTERKARRYTQKSLAKLVGCATNTISHLENGTMLLERFGKRDTLCQILKGMNYEEAIRQENAGAEESR